MSCSIEIVEALKRNDLRAVAFLSWPERRHVDAKQVFDNLKENPRRMLMGRFDHWIEGGRPHPLYHHGWNQSQYGGRYRECYVFKIKVRRQGQRFYGFLAHPLILNRRFVLCVLVLHVPKDQWETEVSDLERVIVTSQDSDVKQALTDVRKKLKESWGLQ